MWRFPEHICSNEVRPVTVAEDIHRMTVDEYVHIVRDFGWESTELIEGVVYDVTPEHNRHMGTVMHVFRQLDAWFPEIATCTAGSVRLSPLSMVDADVFVLDVGVPLDPDDAVPVSAVKLVVEVSVTTQARDRGAKLIAYAKAGVPEVWLIDPRPDIGELVRYQDPDGASYHTVDRFDVGENARDLDVEVVLER
jgi:Uma2 family endonuclease